LAVLNENVYLNICEYGSERDHYYILFQRWSEIKILRTLDKLRRRRIGHVKTNISWMGQFAVRSIFWRL